jgi:hypothetical protein
MESTRMWMFPVCRSERATRTRARVHTVQIVEMFVIYAHKIYIGGQHTVTAHIRMQYTSSKVAYNTLCKDSVRPAKVPCLYFTKHAWDCPRRMHATRQDHHTREIEVCWVLQQYGYFVIFLIVWGRPHPPLSTIEVGSCMVHIGKNHRCLGKGLIAV